MLLCTVWSHQQGLMQLHRAAFPLFSDGLRAWAVRGRQLPWPPLMFVLRAVPSSTPSRGRAHPAGPPLLLQGLFLHCIRQEESGLALVYELIISKVLLSVRLLNLVCCWLPSAVPIGFPLQASACWQDCARYQGGTPGSCLGRGGGG